MVVVEVVVRGGKHSQTLAGLLQVGLHKVDSADKMQEKLKKKKRKEKKEYKKEYKER